MVVKRWGGPDQAFRVGLAEMNGWRGAMEDAHVVVMQETEAFFGVFDGHGGTQCSAFIASRLSQELQAHGIPKDDSTVTDLALRLDREFLATGLPSGSTGTFVIVTPPAEAGGRYRLRVGNIGDSRVLLGRADGTLIEGNGSDGALTTDHKPDHPSERTRIIRTGGTVHDVMGVSRVNGDLAVSRAFGDAQYKETGGPAQTDHPVIAAPELVSLECSPSDFLLLVCDGISECNFPNRQVVQLAAEELKRAAAAAATPGAIDPGAAAVAICRRALERGSKDNLSCMVVLLGGGEVAGRPQELLPGPVDSLGNEGFRKAYEAMAGHAGQSLVEAVESRYDAMRRELQVAEEGTEAHEELQHEDKTFGDGPPTELEAGSQERTEWFAKWVAKQCEQGAAMGGDSALESILMQNAEMLAIAKQQGAVPQPRQAEHKPVIAAEEKVLRAAVEAHVALNWDDRYLKFCGREGRLLERDSSDNTSQVRFHLDKPMTAWFPDETLKPPKARVAELEQFRTVMQESRHEEWLDLYSLAVRSNVQGHEGLVMKVDESKETTLVHFPELHDELWLPSCTLIRLDGNPDESRSGEAPT